MHEERADEHEDYFLSARITASYWKIAEKDQFLHNIAKGGHIDFETEPKEAVQLAKDVRQALNINYAGFDNLMIQGKPYILEFNVLFGNQGLRQGGISPKKELHKYLVNTFRTPSPTTPAETNTYLNRTKAQSVRVF